MTFWYFNLVLFEREREFGWPQRDSLYHGDEEFCVEYDIVFCYKYVLAGTKRQSQSEVPFSKGLWMGGGLRRENLPPGAIINLVHILLYLVCPWVTFRHYLAELFFWYFSFPWVPSLLKLLEICLHLLLLHASVGGEEGQVPGGEGGGRSAHGVATIYCSIFFISGNCRKTPFICTAYLSCHKCG